MKSAIIPVALGLFWAAFMIWWSADFSPVNIAILCVMGLVFASAWTWFMKRMGLLERLNLAHRKALSNQVPGDNRAQQG
jgi:hypothetical protein